VTAGVMPSQLAKSLIQRILIALKLTELLDVFSQADAKI
jgi:hypothetical protein